MARAAFLTYNTVGQAGAWSNGVVSRNGHEAVIVQHPKDQTWGASVNGEEPIETPDVFLRSLVDPEGYRDTAIAHGDMRNELVHGLYSGIFRPQVLNELDRVVVYVGARGSEGAIHLAARAGWKAIFVFCDCYLEGKLSQIRRNGMGNQPYILCECGGHTTMERLVREFLQNGRIDSASLVS